MEGVQRCIDRCVDQAAEPADIGDGVLEDQKLAIGGKVRRPDAGRDAEDVAVVHFKLEHLPDGSVERDGQSRKPGVHVVTHAPDEGGRVGQRVRRRALEEGLVPGRLDTAQAVKVGRGFGGGRVLIGGIGEGVADFGGDGVISEGECAGVGEGYGSREMVSRGDL